MQSLGLTTGRLCRRPQNKHKIEIVQACREPFCGREQSVRVAQPNDRRSKTPDNALADWPFERRNKSHRRGELPLKRINNLVDVGWRIIEIFHSLLSYFVFYSLVFMAGCRRHSSLDGVNLSSSSLIATRSFSGNCSAFTPRAFP